MPLVGCLLIPKDCLLQVFADAQTIFITNAKIILSHFIALFSSFLVPLKGKSFILGGSKAIVVTPPKT